MDAPRPNSGLRLVLTISVPILGVALVQASAFPLQLAEALGQMMGRGVGEDLLNVSFGSSILTAGLLGALVGRTLAGRAPAWAGIVAGIGVAMGGFAAGFLGAYVAYPEPTLEALVFFFLPSAWLILAGIGAALILAVGRKTPGKPPRAASRGRP
jgi:hypothetical protein